MRRRKLNIALLLAGLLFFSLVSERNSEYPGNDSLFSEFSSAVSNPEPDGWYAGDIHVHRSCNGSKAISSEELKKRMEENDLSVISVLGDMGNSQAPDRIEDLQKIDGSDAPQSDQERIIHYSAEWHWDADSYEYPHQAIGGHIVILGPHNAWKIWDERVYKILEWSSDQNAVCGFAHMQYLQKDFPQILNCCIPVDYPVELAFGTVDFISEDCDGGDALIEAYYKLLNCGLRPGLAAGTDFPCNGGAPFGSLLTYVNIVDRDLTYRNWIEGIKKGNTVISRNGHNEFLELTVNDKFIPGDELLLKTKDTVRIKVKWSGIKELEGNVEVVCNGKIIDSKSTEVSPDDPYILEISYPVDESSWICARRMDEKGHQAHTAAVYVTVNNQPLRSNASDALYFVKWIDNILDKIKPGGAWSSYYKENREDMINRYRRARDFYSEIAVQAEKISLK